MIALKATLEIQQPSVDDKDLIFLPMNPLVKEAKDL
jgi:hypothetical protein